VDALGNPVDFRLTGGECADISVAPELLKNVAGCTVIADKGYDSDPLVLELEGKGCIVVIPPRSNRKTPRSYDKHVYKERHLVECFFNKIKEYRRIATRYEKLAKTFLAFVHLAAALIWLR
jgi:transposase